MNFKLPEDTFCRLALKSALFPLARVHSVLPAPMAEFLQRGRIHGRSVIEKIPHHLNLVMIFRQHALKCFCLLCSCSSLGKNLMEVVECHLFIHDNQVQWLFWDNAKSSVGVRIQCILPPPPSINECHPALNQLVFARAKVSAEIMLE